MAKLPCFILDRSGALSRRSHIAAAIRHGAQRFAAIGCRKAISIADTRP
jgi:hypothetical protein